MKIFIVTLLLSSVAMASNLEKAFLNYGAQCNAVVKVQDNVLLVGHNNWDVEARRSYGLYKVTDLSNPENTVPFVTENGERIVDLVKYKDSLFVLTREGLLERSLKDYTVKGHYKTTTRSGKLLRKQHPTGMELVGDKLFIAHGRLGFAIFDINSRALQKTETLSDIVNSEGEESTATDVQFDGKYVYFVMDNYTIKTRPKAIPAFRGFVVYSPEHKAVVKLARIPDPGATGLSLMSNGNLLVNYQGFAAVTEYSVKDILTSKETLHATKRAWKYPNEHYGSNRGKIFIDGDKMYTCFYQSEDEKTFHFVRRVFNLQDLNWR